MITPASIFHICALFLKFHTLALLARLVWGNQEMIWTLLWDALTARPSPRTVALAKPKEDFGKHQCRPLFLYSCGRESTIWERPLLVDFDFPSDWLLKLSEPKKCSAAYLQQRCQHGLQMLRSWPEHPRGYSVSQSPGSGRRPAAMSAAFLTVIRLVSKLAQEAIASPRTLELARAKRLHPDYVPLRDAEWPVTKTVKHAVATPRLMELAQPCKRPPTDSAQFDPDAFTVKETAKKATCSARIQDLARPIKR
ncbi:sperm microtubule associated protein 2-like [Strix uralensis]|uniref:sperm microtubule associated protein 2-like n=1 Tax=Strix uralensis TaxID=36305 RepID=UPI003DA73350